MLGFNPQHRPSWPNRRKVTPERVNPRYVTMEDLQETATSDLVRLLKKLLKEIECRTKGPEDIAMIERTLVDDRGTSLYTYKSELHMTQKKLQDVQCILVSTSKRLQEALQENFKLRYKMGLEEQSSKPQTVREEERVADAIKRGDIREILRLQYGIMLPDEEISDEELMAHSISEIDAQVRKITALINTVTMNYGSKLTNTTDRKD